MISLILFIIAVVAATMHILIRKKKRSTDRIAELFLNYLIPLNIGVMSFICFVTQTFYGKELAKMMGRMPNPDFQFELAMLYLGFALVGILAIWLHRGFWFAVILTNAVFLLGSGWSHISQLMHGMKGTWHGYLYLYVNDILIPLALLALVLFYAANHNFFKEKSHK